MVPITSRPLSRKTWAHSRKAAFGFPRKHRVDRWWKVDKNQCPYQRQPCPEIPYWCPRGNSPYYRPRYRVSVDIYRCPGLSEFSWTFGTYFKRFFEVKVTIMSTFHHRPSHSRKNPPGSCYLYISLCLRSLKWQFDARRRGHLCELCEACALNRVFSKACRHRNNVPIFLKPYCWHAG